MEGAAHSLSPHYQLVASRIHSAASSSVFCSESECAQLKKMKLAPLKLLANFSSECHDIKAHKLDMQYISPKLVVKSNDSTAEPEATLRKERVKLKEITGLLL